MGILIHLAIGAGVLLLFRWKKTEQGRKAWDRALLRIPDKFGDIV